MPTEIGEKDIGGNITGVILAGGLGTRLREVLPDSQKAVAPVAGKPFLGYLLDQVELSGIPRVILCTGHLGTDVERFIGRHWKRLKILYSHETQPLGTGGALRLARSRYPDSGEWLVMNGDSYCDLEVAQLWRKHQLHGLPVTLAAVSVEDGSRYGVLKCDSSHRLLEFGEKNQAGKQWINAGIYALSQPVLEDLVRPEWISPLSLERDVFPQWIPRGIQVVPQQGRFIDIGVPDSYATAQSFFDSLKGRL